MLEKYQEEDLVGESLKKSSNHFRYIYEINKKILSFISFLK